MRAFFSTDAAEYRYSLLYWIHGRSSRTLEIVYCLARLCTFCMRRDALVQLIIRHLAHSQVAVKEDSAKHDAGNESTHVSLDVDVL
jgi:hypothetical protein